MRREEIDRGHGTTRRSAIKTAGALAAGFVAGGADAAVEALALSGGKPAVSYPARKQGDASRWPIYGAEEEKAVETMAAASMMTGRSSA